MLPPIEEAAAAQGAASAAQAPPLSTAEEDLGGSVRFPLGGGVPRVSTPSVAVAPGVSKQLMARGRGGAPPTRDAKCFGAHCA
jgi:hypothetical protein